ncbi:MAG: substrate-binding periplasmic protein, partial [Ramlibacter sp.]
ASVVAEPSSLGIACGRHADRIKCARNPATERATILPLGTITTITMNNHGKAARPVRALLACILGLAACSAAWGMEVRVAAQEAIAPKWIQSAGRVAGICPDIMAAIERVEPRLHFTGYRRSRSLPGIEAGLESGSLDLACALIGSPRRNEIAVPAGKSVYLTRHMLAARAGDPAVVRDLQDLVRMGALVTAQRGSVFTDTLKAAGVRVDDATDDNGVNLHKMLGGHGRFAYVNELTMKHYVRSEHLEARVRVLPVVLGAEPGYFWVSRKADPALAPLLGAAIDRLKADGELERIVARWAANP